ncbi:MAG: hypothetical protein WCK93_02905 [Nitrosomonadales bacterium]
MRKVILFLALFYGAQAYACDVNHGSAKHKAHKHPCAEHESKPCPMFDKHHAAEEAKPAVGSKEPALEKIVPDAPSGH